LRRIGQGWERGLPLFESLPPLLPLHSGSPWQARTDASAAASAAGAQLRQVREEAQAAQLAAQEAARTLREQAAREATQLREQIATAKGTEVLARRVAWSEVAYIKGNNRGACRGGNIRGCRYFGKDGRSGRHRGDSHRGCREHHRPVVPCRPLFFALVITTLLSFQERLRGELAALRQQLAVASEARAQAEKSTAAAREQLAAATDQLAQTAAQLQACDICCSPSCLFLISPSRGGLVR